MLDNPTNSTNQAEREVVLAWRFFGGTFVALVASGIWSMLVGTSSPGADEADLVQGWEGVLRNLPGYAVLIGVAAAGVLFAVKAGIHGSERSRPALIATCLVLLLALTSVTRDSAEVVMTTRAATVSWVAFLCDALVVGVIALVVTRRMRTARGQ
jgi:hypothetical protein